MIVGQDHEAEIADQDHEVENEGQGQDHMVEIIDRGLAVRMVIERARETVVHEAGAEAERDLETKGESIDHEVERDSEGHVAEIAKGQEAGARRGDHEAERDRDQRMTAKRLWKPRMKKEPTMKNDR